MADKYYSFGKKTLNINGFGLAVKENPGKTDLGYNMSPIPIVQHPGNKCLYLLMPDKEVDYYLRIKNSKSRNCDITISIDNNNVGKFRCFKKNKWNIERPSRINKNFHWVPSSLIDPNDPPTGYEKDSPDNGLIRIKVEFEKYQHEPDGNINAEKSPFFLLKKNGLSFQSDSDHGCTTYVNESCQEFGEEVPAIVPHKNHTLELFIRMIPFTSDVAKISWITPFSVNQTPPLTF